MVRILSIGLVLVAIGVVLVGPRPGVAGHELDGRDIVGGAALYQDACAACHGVNLEGQPNWRIANADGTLPAPPHDKTGHTWHHDNQLLFDYTKLGGAGLMAARGRPGFNSGMPGFGDSLSDDEIWNILAYIRSTWPEREREIQAMRNLPHD
ncbi:MAG: cytochrome c [Pseudomonadota bacterium]